MVNVNTLTTKLNGKGVYFKDYFYRSSPLFSALFYDWDSLMNPSAALKPKDISSMSTLLEDGYTVKWRDTDMRRLGDTLAALANEGAASVTVTDGSIFAVGDNVFFPSSSTAHVITSIAGDALTISPVVPTGGLAEGAKVKIISSAIDNRGTVDGKSTYLEVGDEVTNYVQHVSHSVFFQQEELNKILLKYTGFGMKEGDAVNKYTKDVLQKGLREVQHDFVNAFFTGKKASHTIGGKTYRYAGGLNEYITETVDCEGADAKEALFNVIDVLDEVQGIQTMEGGLYSNMLICTRKAASRLSSLVMGQDGVLSVHEGIDLDKIGMRLKVIRTTYGDIPLYIDPIMTELFDDANMAFTFNPKLISVVSTSNLPMNKGNADDMNAISSLAGVKLFKNETAVKQPNSDAVINLYTNFTFMFQGAGMGMYKKLINLGVVTA